MYVCVLERPSSSIQLDLLFLEKSLPRKRSRTLRGCSKSRGPLFLEKQLYDALIRPQLAESARTTEIHDVVAKLEAANLTVMDIDASLWGFCQKVVSGEKLI